MASRITTLDTLRAAALNYVRGGLQLTAANYSFPLTIRIIQRTSEFKGRPNRVDFETLNLMQKKAALYWPLDLVSS
jgi:hypothetical protein